MNAWLVVIVATLYVLVLFALAWWGDRSEHARPFLNHPTMAALSYCLTLAIYNTSWSFYGSIGRAAASGLDFLPIYIGPTLVLLFGSRLMAKVITISKSQNATSISDFLSSRYGKAPSVAALVTLTLLIAVLPYIALQLKAVSAAFDTLTASRPVTGGLTPAWEDTALGVALSMAFFATIFGVRHVHASLHHRGLMIAVAFESLIKLATFVIVALYIAYGMSEGPLALLETAQRDPELARLLTVDLSQPTWISNTIIAAIAFLCLPQAFHVAVVENETPRHIRHAMIFYPLYLVLLSLCMMPIAIAGRLHFGSSVNPDTYIIALPLAAKALNMGLLAFIGGLSAATCMVIVSSVALSTMVCNDVVMPILLRARAFGSGVGVKDLSGFILNLRRVLIFIVLLLAYAMYRLVDPAYPLTLVGLISFVAVAQIGPAFLFGLFWRRANSAGALGGIAVGFLVWTYTLLVPSLSSYLPGMEELVAQGAFGRAWLRPLSLLGVDHLDAISHATFWSLGLNTLMLVALSLALPQNTIERIQAGAFTLGPREDLPLPRASSRVVRLSDLRALVTRFIGPGWGTAAFDDYLNRCAKVGPAVIGLDSPLDLDAVRFTERLLAGAIGAASARIVMTGSLEGYTMSRRAAMAMLDEAAEALRFSRSLLQETVESVPQGICMFDPDLCVIAWNRRFHLLLDLPPELVQIGIPLTRLIEFNRDRGEYGTEDLQSLLTNRNVPSPAAPYIYERIRPDGTVLEISFARLAGGGYVSTYSDVTERHLAAEALRTANETLEQRVSDRTDALARAKAQAEAANLDKTKFLAAVGHDLQQPLHAARLFVATLKQQIVGVESASVVPENAAFLLSSADGALRTTEQLLDGLLEISAIDSRVARANITTFPIADVLGPLAIEFAAIASAKKLALRFVPSSAQVRSDPRLLRRLLQNLIANAVRYTSTGRVLLGCRRRGAMLCVEVWDTGVGIEADQIEPIFREFYRPPHQAESGMGLGLAIAQRTAQLIGANMSVQSLPGQGSCFTVMLPMADLRTESPGLEPRSRALHGVILLIEGDDPTPVLLASLLSEWGCRCITFANLETALTSALPHVIDAVILSGSQQVEAELPMVISHMRSVLGESTACILLSAQPTDSLQAACEFSDIGYLTYPLKLAALRRFLKGAVMRRGRELEPGRLI
ncbi:MAG: histidine kinase [Hyphomicrobiales bacterium]|nr:histidine kinase [Hyphomicrobiales bacterium]